VKGRRAYSSIACVPDQVDMAVIAVPAKYVAGVVGEWRAH
jgi:acyl-CoA synthetase (NDP forming)